MILKALWYIKNNIQLVPKIKQYFNNIFIDPGVEIIVTGVEDIYYFCFVAHIQLVNATNAKSINLAMQVVLGLLIVDIPDLVY